jgi:hypothetical protein
MSAVSEVPRRFAPGRVPRPRDIPAAPPPEVLAEVYAAHERIEELAAAGFHVDFARDAATGRVSVTLRTPQGDGRIALGDVFDLLD